MDLSVSLCGITLKNPIILASGTVGYGKELDTFFPVESMGAIALKATTLKERIGNPPPRITETPSGVINAIGLANKGVDYFEKTIMEEIKEINTVKIANIAGDCVEDYVAVCERLNKHEQIDMFEINVSCPNVHAGGKVFAEDKEMLKILIRKCKDASKKPLIVKLHPDIFGIENSAKLCEDFGADALSITNTIPAMEIDAILGIPKIGNNFGGLSGEAIRPIALRLTYLASKAVKIPIIGVGGISSAEDVLKFMIAGATAVSVGTLAMTSPMAVYEMVGELPLILEKKKVSSVSEIVGTLKIY